MNPMLNSEDTMKPDATMTRRSMLKSSAKLTAGAMALGAAVANMAPEAAVATVVTAELLQMTEEMERSFTTF